MVAELTDWEVHTIEPDNPVEGANLVVGTNPVEGTNGLAATDLLLPLHPHCIRAHELADLTELAHLLTLIC